jgi:hypothetical protein
VKKSDEFVIKKIDSWVTLLHLQLLTKLTDSSRLPRKKHVASLLNAHLHHIIKSIAIAVNSSKGTSINEAFPLGQGINDREKIESQRKNLKFGWDQKVQAINLIKKGGTTGCLIMERSKVNGSEG